MKGMWICRNPLSHELRRQFYRRLNDSSWRHMQSLRSKTDFGERDYSLVPFDQLQCIFVHIPKCGGVSVNRTLFNCLGGGHHSLEKYRKVYSYLEFSQYFKFTVVRNPWSRLFSAYSFLLRGGFGPGDKPFQKRMEEECPTFERFVMDWLDEKKLYEKNHLVPQVDFIRLPCFSGYAYDGFDFIGRFERMNDDFATIANELGLDQLSLPLLNKGPATSSYVDAYSDQMIDKVRSLYHEDIAVLGYQFES